ncbi:galactokinase [Anaerotalea alkaliphila]|uniref:Galactokinase n=1 Tax=Anaerotalea alkaliphila TaxID=2662126 RepID=A0A7X5HUU7_9FIRM|nr:galactokinase [Anaerotalea alkaliphila]NDL67077.1 galactokinase [Anaerotalea alkaliphila]
MKEKMIREFVDKFGGERETVETFFAPGRVNLIGEHIDYNGGHVFPCALDFGTYGAVRKRQDNKLRMASLNFDLEVEVDADRLVYDEADDWANYPKGVVKGFLNRGCRVGGMDILYWGNIPNGAGLSSSASLEVLTAVLVNDLFDCGIAPMDLVLLTQEAENSFVGVNCGIMDQFAVCMGRKDSAMLLDCKTLEYSYAPLVLDGIRIVIGNTRKRRGLADSKYNERRSECEYALAKLREVVEIETLCDLDPAAFQAHRHRIDQEAPARRAEHAVWENHRTLEAAAALQAGDLARFGELMNASHRSLRDLYEVTGRELDAMVEEAWKVDGTIGSRMTGAGFGGCTVSLVRAGAVEDFIKTVGENYAAATGLEPEFYVVDVGAGASRI